MKRDIIINYSKITGIRDSISKYKSALETMESSLKDIKEVLETENSGEAITALIGQYDDIQDYINSCKEELSNLYDLFAGYYYDMTSIIKPSDETSDTEVDRDDIWYNLNAILDSVQEIDKLQRNGTYVNAFATSTSSTSSTSSTNNYQTSYGWNTTTTIDEEEQKNQQENCNKLEGIQSKIGEVSAKIQSYYDEMEQDFNNKIVAYEDMDDSYADKAKSVRDQYSSTWETICRIVSDVAETEENIRKGIATSLWDSIVGIAELYVGIEKYKDEAVIYLASKVTGYEPDWVKSSNENFTETNEALKKIAEDPSIIVEGIAQQVSDGYDRKGIAYASGYGIGLIAQIIFTDGLADLSGAAEGGSVVSKESLILNSTEIDMMNTLASKGISFESSSNLVKTLSSEDLELLNKYLQYKPADFNCDDIIDRIVKGESVDDVIKASEVGGYSAEVISNEFGFDIPKDYIDAHKELYDRYFELKDKGLSHSEINDKLLDDMLKKSVDDPNSWFGVDNAIDVKNSVAKAYENSAKIDSISKDEFLDIKNGLTPYNPEKQFPNAYKEFTAKFDGTKDVACIISGKDLMLIKTDPRFAKGLGRAAEGTKESANFVISIEDAKDVMDNASSLNELAEALGLEADKYSANRGAYLVDIGSSEMKNVRFSTMDSLGANEWWVPGMQTSGGQFEAIIPRIEDVLKNKNVTISKINLR